MTASNILSRLRRTAYRKLGCAWFAITGMKPWTFGYGAYRAISIEKMLARQGLHDGLPERGYGFRIDERIVEYPWLFSRLPAGPGNLLDAGSVLNFDYILDQPSLKSKRIFISTLSPEPQCHWNKGVSYVFEDLRDSCFRDGYFDWIASISTLEHVGLDNTMLYTDDVTKNENRAGSYLQAVSEYRRMLKTGGVLYLSVPFGRHEKRGWFQIFNADMLDQMIGVFAPSSIKEFHFMYQADGWHQSSREESKDAGYFDIHSQKNYEPDYVAASRAIACLEMVK